MNIKPFNNIVLARQIEGSESKKRDSGIVLPDNKMGRFIKLEILEVGSLVEHIKKGDVVYAQPMLEAIESTNPDVGFINAHDILAKVE